MIVGRALCFFGIPPKPVVRGNTNLFTWSDIDVRKTEPNTHATQRKNKVTYWECRWFSSKDNEVTCWECRWFSNTEPWWQCQWRAEWFTYRKVWCSRIGSPTGSPTDSPACLPAGPLGGWAAKIYGRRQRRQQVHRLAYSFAYRFGYLLAFKYTCSPSGSPTVLPIASMSVYGYTWSHAGWPLVSLPTSRHSVPVWGRHGFPSAIPHPKRDRLRTRRQARSFARRLAYPIAEIPADHTGSLAGILFLLPPPLRRQMYRFAAWLA